MPAKYALMAIVALCFTVLCFTWMVRHSLCELTISDGGMELRAVLAYEPKK